MHVEHVGYSAFDSTVGIEKRLTVINDEKTAFISVVLNYCSK